MRTRPVFPSPLLPPLLVSLSAALIASVVATSAARAERGSVEEAVPAPCSIASGEAARIIHPEALTGVRDFDFAELRLEHAARPRIVIEGPAAAIANVSVSVSEGVLTLERAGCVDAEQGIRVTVAAPSFTEIGARGDAVVSSRGVIHGAGDAIIELSGTSSSRLSIASEGEIVVFADGAGVHRFELEAPSLVALHSGSGELAIAGRVAGASLAELGRGTVTTRHLITERLVVDIDGGGTVTALR